MLWLVGGWWLDEYVLRVRVLCDVCFVHLPPVLLLLPAGGDAAFSFSCVCIDREVCMLEVVKTG